MSKANGSDTVPRNAVGGVRSIDVREATLKTATVEVKALVIGGRQVTLSVFRQLPNKCLINYQDCSLMGIPWGRIHYYPAPCDGAPEWHLHVVWQCGSELRRACVNPPSHDGTVVEAVRCYKSEATRYQNAARTLRTLIFVHEMTIAESETEIVKTGDSVSVTLPCGWEWDDLKTWMGWEDEQDHPERRLLLTAIEAAAPNLVCTRSKPPSWEEVRKKLCQFLLTDTCPELKWSRLEAVVRPIACPESTAALWEIVRGMEAFAKKQQSAAEQLHTAYAKLYADLAALPQLFIAV